MSDANRCPSCGSDRPGNRPEGLCLRCLLQQTLDTDPPIGKTGSGVELTVSLGPGPRPRPDLPADVFAP